MQLLREELDRTHTRVQESRRELLGRVEALIGEVTTAKGNIQRQVSSILEVNGID